MRLQTGTPEQAGLYTKKLQRADHVVREAIERQSTTAFVGLVARRGIIAFHRAYGVLTSEPGQLPLPADAIFPLASLTKPITATVAMILVEDGLVSLNRPVSSYIPEFTGIDKHKVMVHHLLTHTSGIRDDDVYDRIQQTNEEGLAVPGMEPTQHAGTHEWLYRGYGTPLNKEPGTEMSYSNYGMEVLGEILRRASGQSLADLYRERLFIPLGMDNTYMVVPEVVRHRVIRFPEHAEHGGWMCTEAHFERPSASGGLYSTAADMAAFGQLFLNGGTYNGARVLSRLSVQEMTRNQIAGVPAIYGDETFGDASWGYGWNVFGSKKDIESGPLGSTLSFGHGGAGRSLLWIDPLMDMVGIVFFIKLPPDYNRPDDLFRNIVMSAAVDEPEVGVSPA